MTFVQSLNNQLDNLHLLKHPFYESWNEGSLSLQALQTYAKEYYHHVAAFPRYISGIHSLCPNLKMRQVLLGNLIEEEQGDENHPELWQRFAEGLGALYAYERQTPEVSKSKIEGLKKHYSINDERSLKFFTVHMEADEWHSEECANLIADLSEEEQEKVMQGSKKGAKLLWSFLDGINVCH